MTRETPARKIVASREVVLSPSEVLVVTLEQAVGSRQVRAHTTARMCRLRVFTETKFARGSSGYVDFSPGQADAVMDALEQCLTEAGE